MNISNKKLDCFKYLNIDKKPLVYIKKSNKKNAGLGIFAKEEIKKNTPIIIYYGEFICNKKIFFEFTKNKENYIKNIAPYLRTSGIIDQQINGKKACDLDNINLKGYLVNDYSSFDDKLSNRKIKNYIANQHNNNVIIKETKDFPIYYSIRDIKKNEELYANYGLPYWLLQNNCNPENIREICKKYGII